MESEMLTAPRTVEELTARIHAVGPGLSRRLQQCATYLAGHLDFIAVSTVADVARAAEVQPSTVMRLCQALGFRGYSQMQALLREAYLQRRPDYAIRLDNLRRHGRDSAPSLLAEFVTAGRKSLSDLANTVDPNALDRSVDLLCAARTVHLAGLRRAYPVACLLAYALEKMDIPSVLHGASGALIQHQALDSDDALFATTFSPFSPETLELGRSAVRRSVPLVCLSDTMQCPLAECADSMLIAKEVDVASFRSLSASMALTMSIAVAVGARRGAIAT